MLPIINNPKGSVVQNASHTTLVKQDIAASDYVPLTPEGILIFCQSQLRNLDDNIQRNLTGQKGLVALQEQVTNFQNKLKACSQGKADGDYAIDDQNKVNELAGDLDSAIANAKACGDMSLAASLQSVKDHLGKNASVSEKEIKEMSGMLDSALSTSRSGAEVKMIELQSLIAKRGTILQLTTGMVKSIDDSLMNIANKIS